MSLTRFFSGFLFGVGGGITNGDKGDIIVSSDGESLVIDNQAVTNAKLSNVNSNTIKGRIADGNGSPTDLTANQAARIISSGSVMSHDYYWAKIANLGGVNPTGVTGIPQATAITLADGTQLLNSFYVPVTSTVTTAFFIQSASGNYTADNTNSIAIYSQSAGVLTKIAETANNGNLWKGTGNTYQTAALIATSNPGDPIVLTGDTVYWVGFLYNSSAQTTAPSVCATIYPATGGNPSYNTLNLPNSLILSGGLAGQSTQQASVNINTYSASTNGSVCAGVF